MRFICSPCHLLVVLFTVCSPTVSAQTDWEDSSLATAFDSLLQLADALPDDSLARKSYLFHEAGKVADDADAIATAITVTDRALGLRLQDETQLSDGILLSAMNLGIYYNKLNQYQQALNHFALVTSRAPNRKEGEAWYQMARSYGYTGEFAAGEKAFLRAAQLPPFNDSPYLSAYLQQQLGSLHLNKNNSSGGMAATEPLRAALNYFVKDGDQEGEMITRNYLGWALSDAGDNSAAISELETALRLAKIIDAYDEDYGSIYSNLGMSHRRKGNLREAISFSRKALAYQDPEYPVKKGPILSNLSTAYRKSGQLDSALYFAQQALQAVLPDFVPRGPSELPTITSINQNRLEALNYLKDTGLAHAARADHQNALAAFRRADELLDAMRRRQLLEDTRNYWRADARGLYDQAIATALQAEDAEALFYFLEKARARLLLDELSANRAAELLPAAARTRLENSARQARLNPETPALTERFRQVQDSILERFPAYAQQCIGDPPPSVAALPEILGDRHLVEYYVSGQQTLALTYSKASGLKAVQLAAPAVWEPLLWEYRKQLTDPKTTLDQTLPLRLFQELIAPLELPANTPLTIIPDNELYLLPFGALLTTSPAPASQLQQWPWLAKEQKIGYAFSVQLLDRARRQSGQGNGRALAVAPVSRISSDVSLSPRLELPATLRTVRHLAGLLPTDTLINESATKTAFRNKADDYSLLHLGTHAYLGGDGSFLLRGDSSNLYSSDELLDHKLKADLVVIGACETGLGEQLIGEGVASLGRGFARRGASGIIMSLWSINDAATADLLSQTYDGLAAGLGPASALRGAGEAYRNNSTNPRFGHPYYWAGLVHYGRNQPLAMVTGKTSWLLWLFVGGAVILLVAIWLRKRF